MQNELLYKNRDWLYYHLIELGKTPKALAEEFGYSINAIHDWSSKVFHLNVRSRAKGLKLTERQRQIIIGGILGDGYVNARGSYRECHAASQKDYLQWKLNELHNLFSHNYSLRLRERASHKTICGVACEGQDVYSMNGLSNDEILALSRLTKIELISRLDPLGFSVFCLDDGCNHFYNGKRVKSSHWVIGTCSFTEEEATYFVEFLKATFDIEGRWEYSKDHDKTDIRVRFNKVASEKINTIIKHNIPNNIQILSDKHIV